MHKNHHQVIHMRAKEFLQEKTANRSQYSAILNDASINIGFECETLLKTKHYAPTVNPDDLSWDRLEPLLNITNRREHEIESCFEDWVEESYTENPSIDEFIKDQFDTNTGLMASFHISPTYGWNNDHGKIYTESGGDELKAFQEAANSLQNALRISVKINQQYHSQDKLPGFWYIEPDESIHGEGTPAEFVSCPYDLKTGLSKLDAFFHWAKDCGHTTNQSTGIHINLSIRDKTMDDYDFLKMMLFFDENYVAELFSRIDSSTAQQMREKLNAAISNNGSQFALADVHAIFSNRDFINILKSLKVIGMKLLDRFDKHFSINARGNGVFEFRGMGGEGYHLNGNDIRRRVIDMAYILRLGSDDSLMVKEYITKVFSMLLVGKFNNKRLGSGHQEPSPELNSFSLMFGRMQNLIKVSIEHPREFLDELAFLVMKKVIILSKLQRQQLISYAKRRKIPMEDFWQIVDSDS